MPGSAILHHWEILMPLFTVTMKADRDADGKNAISCAIHEASVKAGYPDDDIEVLVSSGTDVDRKKRLLAALVEALDGAGTDPNDIMVFFGEIDRASSSFGGGQLAPPVASA
jgi:phenylpyruvate tautomerase PptA (4-oxalocrotonate tautomerase family)